MNEGKFKKGTKFKGNVNKVVMEVVQINMKAYRTASNQVMTRGPFVTVKNLKTNKLSTVGLSMLEHCDVEIIE